MRARDRRRFYRVNAFCVIFSLIFATWMYLDRTWWGIVIDLLIAWANWRTYRQGKRLWTMRRDEAFAVFAEAVAAVPEFAKYEGNVMTLQMNGFTRFLVWHDECWVEKSHV
jgi:hypothetical protein